MNRALGAGFSLLVFLAAASAFSPRPLPVFPPTVTRPASLLLLDATRAGNRIVAVGERGSIFLSDDDGASWRPARTPTAATLTALHFHDARHGWTVGHDAVILRSADGGETWQQVHAAPDEQKPLLAVWFNDEQTGFAAGAYGAFYRSTDGGRNWQPEKITDDDRHINALARSVSGDLYLAGEAGSLRRSHDGGLTWDPLHSPYQGSLFGVLGLNDGALLAYGLRGRIYRSADAGRNWQRIETGSETSVMGGRAFDDGSVVLVGHDGLVLISRDHGYSFTLRKTAASRAIAAVVRASSGDLLLFGESGVWREKAVPPR